MKDSIKFNKIVSYLMPILSGVVIYLIFLFLYLIKNNSLAFPNPNDIIKETFNLLIKFDTYKSIGLSLIRLLLSIIISLILSFILAVLSYRFVYFEKFINPYITIFRTLPLASIIVLLIITVGMNLSSYVVTILVLAPLIYQNIYDGLINVSKDITDAYKLDSCFNLRVLFKLLVPEILPNIKTAIISCVGLGFKVLVMAEFISGKNNSIGYSLKDAYQNNIEMVYVYAWSLILIIMSLLITKLCDILREKKA